MVERDAGSSFQCFSGTLERLNQVKMNQRWFLDIGFGSRGSHNRSMMPDIGGTNPGFSSSAPSDECTQMLAQSHLLIKLSSLVR